jgi:hypothetical protein
MSMGGSRFAQKNLALVLASGLLALALLEGWARFFAQPSHRANPYYVEMSRGFPKLDELISDSQNTHPAPKYYDEFVYAAAPVSLTHINFTNYYSARRTPDSGPLGEAKHIVWTFGGSTMENTETSDELTIANTLARVFNVAVGPTHVKNFGTGGFISSFELIKFQKLLREVKESELPTIAIFYDGYNDAQNGFQYGPGKLQSDLSLKLQALVEKNNLVAATYAWSSWLSKYFTLWDRTAARVVERHLYPLPAPFPDNAALRAAVRVYTNNLRMIQASCGVFQVLCVFILQPLLVTKEPLSEIERRVLDKIEAHPRVGRQGTRFVQDFYDAVRSQLDRERHFIDASRVLNGRTESDFYDLGHTSALTSPVIGEKIAHMIMERFGLKNPLTPGNGVKTSGRDGRWTMQGRLS